MTVLEMQARTGATVRWTEICATEHSTAVPTVHKRVSPVSTQEMAPGRSLPHGHRVPPRPASGRGVRACRVETPTESTVVDDVPAWILLACGVLFGLVLLLALALVGGPAYA